MIEESGAQIIGYDCIDEIGQSAYATTYLARQESPDRIVSLKILKSSKFDPDELRQLFYNAAKIVKLEHPNIASVYDIAVSEKQHYIASEYIPGQSLKHRAKAGVLPDLILDMMMTLVEALCYAHKKGVAHQNIKLENILIRQDGSLALTDFGLSNGIKKNLAHFNANLVNTLDNVKIQWDTYSVGTSLYELITGQAFDKPLGGVREEELPEDYRFLHPLLDRVLDVNHQDYIGNMQLLKAELKNLLEAIPVLGKDSKSKKIETRPKSKKRITPDPANGVEEDIKPLDNQISLVELIQYFFDSLKEKFAKSKNKQKIEPQFQAQENQIQQQVNVQRPKVQPKQNRLAQTSLGQANRRQTKSSPPRPPVNDSLLSNERLIKRWVISATVVVAAIALLVTMPEMRKDRKPNVQNMPSASSIRSTPVAGAPKKKNPEIEKLFKEADRLWGKNYLTKPENENVYSVYQQILDIDQNNQRAREGIARIANYFEQRAQRKKGDGRFESSLADVMSGLKIQPNHAGLIILKSELQTRIKERNNKSQAVTQVQTANASVPAKGSDINKLLDQAELQWRDKKLLAPPGDNAYETYLRALEMDASNKRAALGLNRMATYFEGRAETSLQDDAFRESLNFVEQALKITPENQRLQLLRDELKQKVADLGDDAPATTTTASEEAEQVNVFGNF